jgi:ABC-type antimicrobial peptide transport system, ATPase component
MLRVENVEKYYGGKNNVTKALDRISFQVDKGEFMAIMGASGSGKTTLLNCISTVDEVSAGSILLEGQDITEIKEKELAKFRRENLGFVFQDYNLLDTLTIEENIGLSLTINHEKPQKVQSRVQRVAQLLGIEDILSKFPYQVSGGQKQRAACGRAIVNNQNIILADEPTGALDSKAAKNLLEVFKLINEDINATILMVTHDAYSASYASRILFLKDGKIFNELLKGDKSRAQFYSEVLDVLALLGGDISDVI